MKFPEYVHNPKPIGDAELLCIDKFFPERDRTYLLTAWQWWSIRERLRRAEEVKP